MARTRVAHLAVLGRRGCDPEMMALEWADVDLSKRQVCVASRNGNAM